MENHLNIVFIGHVDAGKSTIGGQILRLTGIVDDRTLHKYEQEAKKIGRESWALSWALDTSQEERAKGKTVEVGKAWFKTELKTVTILDAPGHKSFVPNMIGGASQADIAVLVVSARRGEFETGFERGGQTREHAMLAKTAGINHFIVLINKMDDPTVLWDEQRFNECKNKLIPYLKKCGYVDVPFIPVSGITGAFLLHQQPGLWYKGPSFIKYIDDLPSITRNVNDPFRMYVCDRVESILGGKIEAGSCVVNQSLTVMPENIVVKVVGLWANNEPVLVVRAGDDAKIEINGFKPNVGSVLCQVEAPCKAASVFTAKIKILDDALVCPGYSAVLHVYSCVKEVTINHLIRCNEPGKKGDIF